MLKIRLHRTGKTRRPHYRVVVAEHKRAAQGPYVISLGIWDPLKSDLKLDMEKVKEWMDRGAKPTDRISRLLKKHGMKHKHIQIHERPTRGPKSPKVAEEKPSEQVSAESVTESAKSESPVESVPPTEQPQGQEKPPAVEGESKAEQAKAEPDSVESADKQS